MAETSRQPHEGSIVTRIENKLFEEKDSRFWRATLDLQDHYVINRSTSSITFHPSHDPVAPDECLVLDHTQGGHVINTRAFNPKWTIGSNLYQLVSANF